MTNQAFLPQQGNRSTFTLNITRKRLLLVMQEYILGLRIKLTEDTLLLNANAIFDMIFHKFECFIGNINFWLHSNSHPYDSRLIITDKDGVVEKWSAKEDDSPKL